MGQTHGLDPRAGPDGAVAAAWPLPTSWGAGGTVMAHGAAGDVLTGPARGPPEDVRAPGILGTSQNSRSLTPRPLGVAEGVSQT